MRHKPQLVIGLAVVVLAAAAVVGVGGVGAQSSADSPGEQSITVSATGDAEASPDQAVVRVSVTATANDSATVRDDVAAGVEDLRSTLDELGVEYETSRYEIQERTEPAKRHDRERGTDRNGPDYRGVHTLRVTLDDTDAVGDVVDAAADSGAEVDRVRFTLSDERRTELRDTAIGNAMSDARAQADQIAAAGDLSVTTVDSVEASQRQYRPVRYEAGDGAAAPRAALEGGDVSVTYSVQVTYNATAP